jgi:predicted Ser/Thr protein kinase
MPRVLCPHCQAGQEVETPAPGSAEVHACSSCGGSFSIPVGDAAAGTTRRLAAPPAAESTLRSRPAAAAPGVPGGMPQRLGPYQVLETLGAGGMGVVYRGYDARLNRNVALKTLRPELSLDPEYRERFLREARSAAALSHPNVTQIYFIGEEEGQPFFAMEFLEGKSLETLVREQGKLPPGRAVEMIRQAAAGLKAAAARGIVHRDIKPSNLALTSDGTLKVTDFGLAKLAVGDAGLTLAGEVLGSPNYMAPEQASGHPADLRSDIYSLGATLYELVTGKPPFEGPTPVSVILKHAREPVRNPRQLTPGLPYPLVILIQKMLAKRPEDRPQTYDALLRDLERLGAGAAAEPARAPIGKGRPARPGTPASARSSRSWIVAPVLILALLGGWGLLRQRQAGGGPPAEAGGSPATPTTGVLSSTTDVSPPGLGLRRPGRAGFGIAPRMEPLREARRADLQFVTNTHEITADGRLRVMGSVVNAGMGRASEVRIRILLTDSAGRSLDSTEVALAPPLLGPHQTGTFEAVFPDPGQMVSIRTELNWSS